MESCKHLVEDTAGILVDIIYEHEELLISTEQFGLEELTA